MSEVLKPFRVPVRAVGSVTLLLLASCAQEGTLPSPRACGDGTAGASDRCGDGAGPALCSDNDPCDATTAGGCRINGRCAALGVCEFDNAADGLVCATGVGAAGTCAAGTCGACWSDAACDDADDCTLDSCAITGCADVVADDGTACTQIGGSPGVCASGTCVAPTCAPACTHTSNGGCLVNGRCGVTGTCVYDPATAGAACTTSSGTPGVCDGATQACGTNGASYVSQSVPTSMNAGQTYGVSVTMTNVGTTTWSTAALYRLGSQAPQDNGVFGLGRVGLPGGDVGSGVSVTFNFNIVAPSAPGLYDFQWRMVQDGVEWFGDTSAKVRVAIGVVVCDAARAYAGVDADASVVIQQCISGAPAGSVVLLPAGAYCIDHQVHIDAQPVTLTTEGKAPTDPKCLVSGAPDCAELVASPLFFDIAGIVVITAPGSTVDHLVLNGNKTARAASQAATMCASGSNGYGYNARLMCSSCSFTKNVSKNALCGTALEVSGAGSNVTVTDNTITDNGVHTQGGMWSDGITVHDYASSTFARNDLSDNTDVGLIFGGCKSCVIRDNVITQGSSHASGSFAAMMMAHFGSPTSGDYTGAEVTMNSIDCGPSHECGFGLLIGSDAWDPVSQIFSFGGSVHHNSVHSAQIGVAIDDAHDIAIYDNSVTDVQSTLIFTFCGQRNGGAYFQGSRSYAIDTSLETLGTTYSRVDWDGCVPNP